MHRIVRTYGAVFRSRVMAKDLKKNSGAILLGDGLHYYWSKAMACGLSFFQLRSNALTHNH